MKEKRKRSIITLHPKEQIKGLEEFRQKHNYSPGTLVPFHVTMNYDFYPLDFITNEIEERLLTLGKSVKEFKFKAVPISSFPRGNVLYLSPYPISPFEKFIDKFNSLFPEISDKSETNIFHMTVAFNYTKSDETRIVDEFISKFGSITPFELTACNFTVYVESGEDVWSKFQTYSLGEG